MLLKSTLKLFNPLIDSLLVAQISVTDSKIDKRNWGSLMLGCYMNPGGPRGISLGAGQEDCSANNARDWSPKPS